MQCAPVDAVIGAEARIFGCDHGGDGPGRYVPERRDIAFVGLARDRPREHQRRDRRDDGIEGDKPNENNEKRDPGPTDAAGQDGEE